ncbi:MAG: hypothetical protein HYX76_00060 [Acidobacteria bacterium]|nr:hypothetical protein [Acidobacteriota bacterium]
MIRFACTCGEAIRVPDNLANLTALCPKCDRTVQVPIPADVRGWIRAERSVNFWKSPLAFIARPGDPHEIEVQAATAISGIVYVYAWLGLISVRQFSTICRAPFRAAIPTTSNRRPKTSFRRRSSSRKTFSSPARRDTSSEP